MVFMALSGGALGLCLARIVKHRLKVGQRLKKHYERVSARERERGNAVEQC